MRFQCAKLKLKQFFIDFSSRCSVDSTQSLSPNFMHSPPAAARAIGRQRRLTETSQGVGGGRVVELMGCSQVSNLITFKS